MYQLVKLAGKKIKMGHTEAIEQVKEQLSSSKGTA